MSISFNGIVVDDGEGGSNFKGNVKVATVAAINISTIQNGSVIDGVTISTGDRIFVKNQTNLENGIYDVLANSIIRSSNYQIDNPVSGSIIWVDKGIVNKDTAWFCTNDLGEDVIGTNILEYKQFDGNLTGPESVNNNEVAIFTSPTNVVNSSVTINSGEISADSITLNTVTIDPGLQSPSVVTIPNMQGNSQDLVLTNTVQNLTNKTIDNISLASHASRHLPLGSDPISTNVASSLTLNSTNTEGTNNSFCRSDHTHSLNLLNAVGQLIGFNGTTSAFNPGLDGQILSSNSSDPFGLRWVNNDSIKVTIIRDEKPIGTNGGTFQNNAWRIRDLNKLIDSDNGTELSPSSNGITLSNNRFTIPAGIYSFVSIAPAFAVNENQTRLRNITDNTINAISVISFSRNDSVNSILNTIINISSTKTFELQHRSNASQNNDGFGRATGFGVEIYTSIFIQRLQ